MVPKELVGERLGSSAKRRIRYGNSVTHRGRSPRHAPQVLVRFHNRKFEAPTTKAAPDDTNIGIHDLPLPRRSTTPMPRGACIVCVAVVIR